MVSENGSIINATEYDEAVKEAIAAVNGQEFLDSELEHNSGAYKLRMIRAVGHYLKLNGFTLLEIAIDDEVQDMVMALYDFARVCHDEKWARF